MKKMDVKKGRENDIDHKPDKSSKGKRSRGP
jgi:hypothetical protein